jgi:hypothetical protein|tara:strand:- start:39 stop:209 length:171 start_codon:yes stop_codon:yes gene_type:complete
MKEYVFLDENNIVIKIDFMNIENSRKDFVYSAAVSIENNVRPEVGQFYNALTNTFE